MWKGAERRRQIYKEEWWKRNFNAFSYDKLDFCPFIFIFLPCSFIFIFRKQDTGLTAFPDEPNCDKFRNFKAAREKRGGRERERNELRACDWKFWAAWGCAISCNSCARVGQFYCAFRGVLSRACLIGAKFVADYHNSLI